MLLVDQVDYPHPVTRKIDDSPFRLTDYLNVLLSQIVGLQDRVSRRSYQLVFVIVALRKAAVPHLLKLHPLQLCPESAPVRLDPNAHCFVVFGHYKKVEQIEDKGQVESFRNVGLELYFNQFVAVFGVDQKLLHEGACKHLLVGHHDHIAKGDPFFGLLYAHDVIVGLQFCLG